MNSSINLNYFIFSLKSYGRRPLKSEIKTLDEPETKKFKPEIDEKPIVKSLSDTDILKDSNEVDVKLTKSTSLLPSSSSAEKLRHDMIQHF